MVSEQKRILLGDALRPSIIRHRNITEGEVSSLNPNRYLDPDPLLLATAHGGNRGPQSEIQNPKFHALNQAVVQLVSHLFDRS